MPPLPDGYTVPTSFTEVVMRMHAACTYFLRPQPADDDVAVMWYNYMNLYIFAQSMELTFGVGPALTSNLHTVVCRLADQCLLRGHSGYEGELWIERCVQVCTRVLGDAVSINPEGLMAKRLCYDDAIFKLQREYGLSFDDSPALFKLFERDTGKKVYI